MMSTDNNPADTTEAADNAQVAVHASDLPAVHVRRQRWPSPVWLIPLAALLVGFWLLYQYWQQRGEVITVHFPSAEGIVAGSTEVRYKAVTVGKVKQVVLDDELNPLVTLSLSKTISPVLDCSAQFWVVKPRVRGAEISGIGTLFSGTYIGMIPQRAEPRLTDNSSMFCYEGLDSAPVIRPERPGREFKLLTDRMGSLDVGAPLFYKQLEVGEVIEYKLPAASDKIEIGVFVDQPYYRFISENTRFWNASGAEFKMDSAGAEFRMESLTSLVIGGIAFDTPRENGDNLITSAEGSVFELYPDFASSREKRYTNRLYYTLYFNGSLRGLAEKAPVEFQGIRVGQVEKIKMHLDPDNLDVRIPVLMFIEPQRFSEELTEGATAREFMDAMVDKGMRATLQSGNLLTGQKYVALAFDEDAPPDEIKRGQFYAVFPTSPTPVEELSKLAMGMAEDVETTLASIRRFMESRQLDKTVEGVNRVLSETETTVVVARETMEDVSRLLGKFESETLPAISSNVNVLGSDASQVLRQLDQKTLPAISNNVNRLGNDVSQVMKRVDQQTLPTLARGVNQLTKDSSQILQQVSKETLPAVRSTSGAINKTSMDFSRSTVELNKTMVRLQNTLGHLDRMLAQNSPTQYQLMEMMEEITAMARSVRLLTEQLERQPESVLRGKRELQ